MVNPKATYDYGTGVLRFDLKHEITSVYLTGEEFDSIVEQLAEICTSDVMDYDLGFDEGYAEAGSEVPNLYNEGYDDGYDDAGNDRESIWNDGYEAGYDDGHRDGYKEAQQEIVSSKGDKDDE